MTKNLLLFSLVSKAILGYKDLRKFQKRLPDHITPLPPVKEKNFTSQVKSFKINYNHQLLNEVGPKTVYLEKDGSEHIDI